MERYRPNNQEVTGHKVEKDPADIKLAKFGKTVDKIQIAAGVGMLFFPATVALGWGFIIWNGAQHIAQDKYINWRRKNMEQKSQSLQRLPQAA